MRLVDQHADDLEVLGERPRVVRVGGVDADGMARALKVENVLDVALGGLEILGAVDGEDQRQLPVGEGAVRDDAGTLDHDELGLGSSEERRVGKESAFTCRFWWARYD